MFSSQPSPSDTNKPLDIESQGVEEEKKQLVPPNTSSDPKAQQSYIETLKKLGKDTWNGGYIDWNMFAYEVPAFVLSTGFKNVAAFQDKKELLPDFKAGLAKGGTIYTLQGLTGAAVDSAIKGIRYHLGNGRLATDNKPGKNAAYKRLATKFSVMTGTLMASNLIAQHGKNFPQGKSEKPANYLSPEVLPITIGMGAGLVQLAEQGLNKGLGLQSTISVTDPKYYYNNRADIESIIGLGTFNNKMTTASLGLLGLRELKQGLISSPLNTGFTYGAGGFAKMGAYIKNLPGSERIRHAGFSWVQAVADAAGTAAQFRIDPLIETPIKEAKLYQRLEFGMLEEVLNGKRKIEYLDKNNKLVKKPEHLARRDALSMLAAIKQLQDLPANEEIDIDGKKTKIGAAQKNENIDDNMLKERRAALMSELGLDSNNEAHQKQMDGYFTALAQQQNMDKGLANKLDDALLDGEAKQFEKQVLTSSNRFFELLKSAQSNDPKVSKPARSLLKGADWYKHSKSYARELDKAKFIVQNGIKLEDKLAKNKNKTKPKFDTHQAKVDLLNKYESRFASSHDEAWEKYSYQLLGYGAKPLEIQEVQKQDIKEEKNQDIKVEEEQKLKQEFLQKQKTNKIELNIVNKKSNEVQKQQQPSNEVQKQQQQSNTEEQQLIEKNTRFNIDF